MRDPHGYIDQPRRNYYDISEVSEITKEYFDTVKRWAMRNGIPTMGVGRNKRYVFNDNDLQQFIEDMR